jgi:tripartite-type tricarboxylate transporter receptor subunit TctC
MFTRRAFTTTLACTLASAALLLAGGAAHADTYPSKTIEWVVPYAAGGGTDVVARVLAEAMSKTLGSTVIISNKPGAGTNIGATFIANAKPDGYTIGSADTGTLAANIFIYSKPGFDPAKDFAPIGLTVRFPMVLVVNPQVPVSNLKEFTAWAKANENKGNNYGTPGAGSPHHLATALFGQQTGLQLTHVPYRGAAPAVQDVMAGTLPFMFVDTASGQQFITSGKLKPIGIASAKRVAGFDSIPTLEEQGLKGFEAYAWQGLVAPKGTPADIIAKLNKALTAALANPDVKSKLTAMGLEITPSNPEQMAKYAAAERAKWGPVIKANHITID